MTHETGPAADNRIPTSLAPFFQEYDLEALDPDGAASTIMERTLRFGNRDELRWLFKAYAREDISAWVERWGRQCLPAPHHAFWALILQLDDRK